MADLTIAVDGGTLKKARMCALEDVRPSRRPLVNGVLQGYFEGSAGRGLEQVEVARRIVAASRESVSSPRPGGWKRQDTCGDCVS